MESNKLIRIEKKTIQPIRFFSVSDKHHKNRTEKEELELLNYIKKQELLYENKLKVFQMRSNKKNNVTSNAEKRRRIKERFKSNNLALEQQKEENYHLLRQNRERRKRKSVAKRKVEHRLNVNRAKEFKKFRTKFSALNNMIGRQHLERKKKKLKHLRETSRQLHVSLEKEERSRSRMMYEKKQHQSRRNKKNGYLRQKILNQEMNKHRRKMDYKRKKEMHDFIVAQKEVMRSSYEI